MFDERCKKLDVSKKLSIQLNKIQSIFFKFMMVVCYIFWILCTIQIQFIMNQLNNLQNFGKKTIFNTLLHLYISTSSHKTHRLEKITARIKITGLTKAI